MFTISLSGEVIWQRFSEQLPSFVRPRVDANGVDRPLDGDIKELPQALNLYVHINIVIG